MYTPPPLPETLEPLIKVMLPPDALPRLAPTIKLISPDEPDDLAIPLDIKTLPVAELTESPVAITMLPELADDCNDVTEDVFINILPELRKSPVPESILIAPPLPISPAVPALKSILPPLEPVLNNNNNNN